MNEHEDRFPSCVHGAGSACGETSVDDSPGELKYLSLSITEQPTPPTAGAYPSEPTISTNLQPSLVSDESEGCAPSPQRKVLWLSTTMTEVDHSQRRRP